MVTLLLRRHKPLGMGEIGRLPSGCVAVQGEEDIVARAQLDVSLERLLHMTANMVRVIPDARFDCVIEGEGVRPARRAPLPTPRDTSNEEPAPPTESADPVPPASGPWALLAKGQIDGAMAEFEETSLDSEGRDRVRLMLHSTDPQQVALGCRIAGLTGWRSAVQNIRRVVRHGDTDVRLRAAEAIGKLAGPGMIPVIQPLLRDANPEVREAAQAALETLEGR